MVYVPYSLQTTVWVLFNHKNSERAADKNLEILNLELGKEVRSREKLWYVPNFSMEGLPAGIIGIRSHVSF